MAIMTHEKFHFNRLMVTLIFGIRACEPPPPPPKARRTTEKAGPDRINVLAQIVCIGNCMVWRAITKFPV